MKTTVTWESDDDALLSDVLDVLEQRGARYRFERDGKLAGGGSTATVRLMCDGRGDACIGCSDCNGRGYSGHVGRESL